MNENIICSDCGYKFQADFNNIDIDICCPNCKSKNIKLSINLEDKINTDFHENIKIVAKKNGKKKPFKESVEGEELFKQKGVWVNKKRVIDRENNSYLEVVKDNAGNEIHYCNEKLSDHFGHGSAKVLCTFIVLNYNDSFTTENLVDKLVDYSCVEKIVIVDNKSPDDSFSILSNQYKDISKVVVIQTDKNGGYSYGNNYGIDFFLKGDFRSNFVVISNPDIFITEKDLISLLQTAKTDEKIGAIAPMMNIENLDSLKISAWKQPTYFYDYLASVPFLRRFAEKLIRYKRSCFSNELMQVDVIPGSFILMPKLLLKNGIKFDERFFLYCEERVLCEKIRKAGYKIILATNLKYDHFESVSIKKNYKKATERQKLLNDSKKKYYQFYRPNNKIKNFLLFFAMDLNFAFMKFLCNLRLSK